MLKKRLSYNFFLSHPIHILALGFGSGLSPIAPGTIGTLLAWLIFFISSTYWPHVFTAQIWAIIIALGFIIGIWICEYTSRACDVADHSAIVWDEMIAFWCVLWLIMPTSYLMQTLAFVLFRGFDILKPPPISYFDRQFKNGFGVMLDDMMAAIYTFLVLACHRYLF